MKHIGGARYRIALENPSEVKNEIGGTVVTYVKFADLWAYRRHRTGANSRSFNGDIEVTQERFEYTIGVFHDQLTEKTRVVDGGRSFTIDAIDKQFDHTKIICGNSSSQTFNK